MRGRKRSIAPSTSAEWNYARQLHDYRECLHSEQHGRGDSGFHGDGEFDRELSHTREPGTELSQVTLI